MDLNSNLEAHHLQVSVCQSQKGKSQNVAVALSPAVGCTVLLPEWHPVRIPRSRHSRLWTIPELRATHSGKHAVWKFGLDLDLSICFRYVHGYLDVYI